MTPAPGATKQDWRQHFRLQLSQLAPADRSAHSTLICNLLEARPEWQRARAVLLFVPTLHEPDVTPLLSDALAAGKIVTLPRHFPDEDSYSACRILNLHEDLAPGRFGISEPRPGCPIFPPNELDFALVPGIGFSFDGGRLGRGRGYFDRLLAAVPGFKCGVAFDCQVAIGLPLEPHDVHLDCLLTPTRWHQTPSRARS